MLNYGDCKMIDSLLQKAEDLHSVKRFDEEISCLQKALDLTNDDFDLAMIYEKIGSSYYLLNELNKSEDNFNKALDKCSALPGNEAKQSIGILNYKLGSIYFARDDFKKALNYCKEAHKYAGYLTDIDLFMLFVATGLNYEKLNLYEKATEYFLKAKTTPDISPDDRCMVLSFLGRCYDRIGELRKAYDSFRELFSIAPQYDGGWYLYYRFAKLSYNYREFNTSLNYFTVALKMIPATEVQYLQSSLKCLGYIFLEKEIYGEAIKHLKKALKYSNRADDKAGAQILSGLAQAYFGQNKFAKTIKYSKKAIEIPHSEDTLERSYFLLAFCYSIKKDNQKEQYFTEKLRNLKPNSPYLKDLERRL